MKDFKTITTPEQGKELLALGVPESTADLLYEPWPGNQMHLVEKDHECGFGEVPAWSLGALIAIMPTGIIPKLLGEKYDFRFAKYDYWEEDGSTKDAYSICYSSDTAQMKGDYLGASCPSKECKDMIDCAVALIKDMAKAGYLEERFPSVTPDKSDLMKVVDDLFGGIGPDVPLAEKICQIGAKYRQEHPEEK